MMATRTTPRVGLSAAREAGARARRPTWGTPQRLINPRCNLFPEPHTHCAGESLRAAWPRQSPRLWHVEASGRWMESPAMPRPGRASSPGRHCDASRASIGPGVTGLTATVTQSPRAARSPRAEGRGQASRRSLRNRGASQCVPGVHPSPSAGQTQSPPAGRAAGRRLRRGTPARSLLPAASESLAAQVAEVDVALVPGVRLRRRRRRRRRHGTAGAGPIKLHPPSWENETTPSRERERGGGRLRRRGEGKRERSGAEQSRLSREKASDAKKDAERERR